MTEKNPRSKLSLMKRKYFFTTAGTFLAIFLIFLLFEEIFSTIFELSPVWRMTIVIGILIFDIRMTDYLVNRDFNQKWLRPVPEVKVVEIKKKTAPPVKMKTDSVKEIKNDTESQKPEDTDLVKLENLVDETIAKEKK